MGVGFTFRCVAPHGEHLYRSGISGKLVEWEGTLPPNDALLGETPTVDDSRVDGYSEKEYKSVAMIKSYCTLCLTRYTRETKAEDCLIYLQWFHVTLV